MILGQDDRARGQSAYLHGYEANTSDVEATLSPNQQPRCYESVKEDLEWYRLGYAYAKIAIQKAHATIHVAYTASRILYLMALTAQRSEMIRVASREEYKYAGT